MPPSTIEILLNYGVLGISCIALAYYILRKDKLHAIERKDWKETSEAQFQQTANLVERNTQVMTEMKTLVQSLDRRHP